METTNRVYLKQLAIITVAAVVLIATLAWNTAVTALFNGPCGTPEAGPFCGSGSWGLWIYAIVATVVAVIIMAFLARFTD